MGSFNSYHVCLVRSFSSTSRTLKNLQVQSLVKLLVLAIAVQSVSVSIVNVVLFIRNVPTDFLNYHFMYIWLWGEMGRKDTRMYTKR